MELVKQLPPTQSALLDWAINLMADVVQEEIFNKMNARNIAMVFAPNMTQVFAVTPCLLCVALFVVTHTCVTFIQPAGRTDICTVHGTTNQLGFLRSLFSFVQLCR